MIMWIHKLLVKIKLSPRAQMTLSMHNEKDGSISAYGDHKDLLTLVRHFLSNPTTKPLIAEAMRDVVMKDLDNMESMLGKDAVKEMKDSIKPKENPEA